MHFGPTQPKMKPWAFDDYVSETNENLTARWYEAQADEVKAEFDVTLSILSQTDDWTEPPIEQFKVLTGRHAGLDEIRFYVDEREAGAARATRHRFRALGVLSRDTRTFVLIAVCEKRGMNTIPPLTFDRALTLQQALKEGKGSIHEHH